MAYLAFYRMFRPSTFDEVVRQEHIVRILKNQMSRKYVQLEKEAAGRDELEALTLGALRRAVLEGDIANGSVMMGQVAGMCKEILPLEQIFDTICRQAGLIMTAIGEKAVELNA